MTIRKDMIIHLIAELIKKSINISLIHLNLLEETLMSKLIYLIMQQNLI